MCMLVPKFTFQLGAYIYYCDPLLIMYDGLLVRPYWLPDMLTVYILGSGYLCYSYTFYISIVILELCYGMCHFDVDSGFFAFESLVVWIWNIFLE